MLQLAKDTSALWQYLRLNCHLKVKVGNEQEKEHPLQTSRKHVRVMYIPLNPTFIYSKTGIYRDLPIFLIFATKIDCGYSLDSKF